MSTTLVRDRQAVRSGDPGHLTPTPRPKLVGPRRRAALRLAVRQIRRTKWASAMMASLIALPVAGMVAFAVISMSMMPTTDERVRAELGDMQAWMQPVGVADAGLWQVPATPDIYGYPEQSNGYMQIPEGERLTDPASALPAGTSTVKLTEGGVTLTTPDGLATVDAFAGDVLHERFEGRFTLLEGRVPVSQDEALVTPATFERLGTAMGRDIVVHPVGHTYTIVGTVSAVGLASDESGVFLPQEAPVEGETKWYLPDLALTWADVQDLNDQGVVAYSRTVVLDPPPVEETAIPRFYFENNERIGVYLLLGVSGVFAAYVVVMLAGAAFAVSARRQQRSLAIVASVGAEPRDLRRIILTQGSLLGVIGGIAGLLIGIAAAVLIMRLTDDGSGTRYWGLHIPWLILLGILIFAVLVGTASAAIPARSVAQSDALGALRGARRPQVPQPSRPAWGSVMLLVGVAVTIVASIGTVAVNDLSHEQLAWDSPLRVALPFGIVVGPILVQVGMLVSGHWLLWLTARALTRVSLAARIAARDAAANASRTVPAFAAIGVTVFIAVFALSAVSMENQRTERNWFYQAPVGTLVTHIYANGEPALTEANASEGAEVALDIAAVAGSTGVATMLRQDPPYSYAHLEDPGDALWVMAVMPERHLLDPKQSGSFNSHQDRQNPISVIDADELETAVGVTLTPAQLEEYRSGAALVLDDLWATDGTVDISTWTVAQANEGSLPNNIWTEHEFETWVEPQSTDQVPAIVVPRPNQPTAIAIAPTTADAFGMDVKPATVFAAFDEPLTTEQLDRVQARAEWSSSSQMRLMSWYEQGPHTGTFWMVPVLGAVAVLVVGASAVALGLARFERRPDDATLAAVGATRGLRRNVSFWQGLIIAGFGMLMGAVTGILPPIGLAIQSTGSLLIGDIPWMTIGLLTIGLPLVIATVAWLVPPRSPELTRRTAIA